MPRITTFLTFVDQAEAAVDLYVSVFPNSEVTSTSRYGAAGPGPKGSVMVMEFQLDGQPFIALNGGPHFQFTDAVSLSVDCKTQQEVDAYTDKLTVGGGEEGPCGWVKDRFGVSWQINPGILGKLLRDPDPRKAARVMQVMLKMKRIKIAELERAYRGE